jgi:hypothetical protein
LVSRASHLLASSPQLFTVVCNPIQSFVVIHAIVARTATEHVRVIARLVIYKLVIPRSTKVFFGLEVSTKEIVSLIAVLFVLATPRVGMAARQYPIVSWAAINSIGTSIARERIGAGPTVESIPLWACAHDISFIGTMHNVFSIRAIASLRMLGAVRAMYNLNRPSYPAPHN